MNDANDELAAIKHALHDPRASIHLVYAFSIGRGAQVFIKGRKIGPIIFPSENQTLADVLRMLGEFAEADEPDHFRGSRS